MSVNTKAVLVIGATGETGSRLVKVLQSWQTPVRALVRNPEKAATIAGEGVEIIEGNPLDPHDLRKALDGIKLVASAMGTRNTRDPEDIKAIEHTFMETLVEEATRAGVEQVVICSSIGTEEPDKYQFIAPILRVKRLGEQALEQSSLNYTIVRPGGLNNNPGGLGVIARRNLPHSGQISREDVAQVMAQAFIQPAARNKIVEIINGEGEKPANSPELFANL